MARGTRTLIGTLIGPGRPVMNITSSITCYPPASLDSDGLSVTSGSGLHTFGDWVQFIGGAAASTVSFDFAVLGVTFESVATDGEQLGVIQVGIGSDGSQEVVESIYLGRHDIVSPRKIYQTVYLPLPRYIPADSEVWLRLADDSETERVGRVKIVYASNLRGGGQFINSHLFQNSFNTVECSSASSRYGFGAWQDVITSGVVTTDAYIRGIIFGAKYEGNHQYHIQVGTGTVASLTTVIEAPYSLNYWRESGAYSEAVCYYIPFPIMYKIPANARTAVRIAKDASGSQDFYVTLDLVKGTLYT